MNIFESRKQVNGKSQVPVWFMRQAGRYHSHYQGIKKEYDFMTMCKTPELATKVTMGPIDDFDFDAAILFSDLLFPLEHMGLGLSYAKGPPELSWHVRELADLNKIQFQGSAQDFYAFQKKALTLLKKELPQDKTLLGFVGAPFTLYAYAVEGHHAGGLNSSKTGLYDGRYHAFMEKLIPDLVENMKIQAEGGADAMCLFDTAAGELSPVEYQEFLLPYLRQVTSEFKKIFPQKKVIYYSKLTHLSYLERLEDSNIDVLGVDWRMDLAQALKTLGKNYYIQGNIDPSLLFLPWPQLEKRWQRLWNDLQDQNLPLSRWICGLGHGVLVGTPQENVRNSVQLVHRLFQT